MIDFGIITDFYKQSNYGGILQAYALAKAILKKGYTCQQIRYDNKKDCNFKVKMRILFYEWRHLIVLKKGINYLNTLSVRSKVQLRQNAMNLFIKKYIPASDQIYNRKNISNSLKQYKGFIAGSDQIWSALSDTNLLDFVPVERKKFSYAASIARSQLIPRQKELFIKNLPSFQDVSVREKQSVDQLAKLGIKSQWVLDPTLLLSIEDWNQICAERKVDESYIFCYFLGTDEQLRTIATEYAKTKGLKIVALPHLQKVYNKYDAKFGDIQLYDISPADFISLIRYSEFVITDSFHGTVFSYIYKKQFVVFERPPMNIRMQSLLGLIGCEERLLNCYDELIMDQLSKLIDLKYNRKNEKFESLYKKSWSYLEQNLYQGTK